jgi:hypothetical protein
MRAMRTRLRTLSEETALGRAARNALLTAASRAEQLTGDLGAAVSLDRGPDQRAG